MAIFDLETIYESQGYDELDNILENCNYMLNVLLEKSNNGTAYDRTVEKVKQDKHNEIQAARRYDKLSDELTGRAKEKALDNSEKHLDNYSNLKNKYDRLTGGTNLTGKELGKNDMAGMSYIHAKNSIHNARQKFYKDQKNPNDGPDRLAAKNPGMYAKNSSSTANDKKKAIKETCLTILSIIDDL